MLSATAVTLTNIIRAEALRLLVLLALWLLLLRYMIICLCRS